MRRLAGAASLIAIAALAAAAPANAAVAKTCNKLSGKSKLRTATIKVVEVKVNDKRLKGRRAYGCVLPRGKVFKVADRGTPKSGPYENANQVQYALLQNAGRFLAIDRSQGDGVAQTGTEQHAVMDLRTGKNRRFYRGDWGEFACEGEAFNTSSSTPPVQRLVMSTSGVFAVHYADTYGAPEACYPNDGQALVRGFPLGGSAVQLDLAPAADIPADSLSVDGTTVAWTNAGQQKSRDLATTTRAARAQSTKRNDVINVGIVGGSAAAPGQFPWMVGLVSAHQGNTYQGLFCGGAVIAPRVVITAAHCTVDEGTETMDVVVGRTRISGGDVGKRIAVSAIVNHPAYDGNRYRNDIALVQLAEPVDITPIRLPRLEDAPLINPAARTTSSGWGSTSEGGEKSDDLLYVRLTVRSMSTCARRYRQYGVSIRTQICAGGKEGEDTCQGDSGGPLFAGQGVTSVLLGLVSYGDGCARAGVPGVYTRVAGYSQWVRENTAILNGDTPPPPPEPGEPPRVSVGAIQCGVTMCRVRLNVTGRVPEGGILVNVTRRKTKRRPAVDRSVYARELSTGVWEARVNLPVGRVRLRAFPLNDTRDQVDGRGAVEQLRVTAG